MRTIKLISFLTLCMLLQSFLWFSDPEENWAESVVKARAEINTLYSSGVQHKGNKATKITVDVSSLDQLVLVADGGGNGFYYDQAAWANAKLITHDGEEIWLDELEVIAQQTGWGKVQKNMNVSNKPITIAGKKYQHGIFAHAYSEAIFKLDRKYKTLQAEVGIEDLAIAVGSSRFHVKDKRPSKFINQLEKKFPKQVAVIKSLSPEMILELLDKNNPTAIEKMLSIVIDKLIIKEHFQNLFEQIQKEQGTQKDTQLLELFERIIKVLEIQEQITFFDIESISLAFDDLKTHKNFNWKKYQEDYNYITQNFTKAKANLYNEKEEAVEQLTKIIKAKNRIMLANPLMDMDKIIFTRYKLDNNARTAMGPQIGTQVSNWTVHMSQAKSGFDCELVELTNIRTKPNLKTLYKPKNSQPINSLNLHWNANKMMFTTVADDKSWQIFEMNLTSHKLKRLTNINEPDLEFFDANYLPSGKIVAASNISYTGVPCVNGSDAVGSLCLIDPKKNSLRKLNFGQDNDWDPVVMNNGRLMYLRWEYTDNTHYFSRIMMHMNPDGTNKKELYGSGSYWPNSMFDAKPLPGENNNQFVAVVSGHHGTVRSGRLVLFDPSKGRKEEVGVMQEIPRRNQKVVPEIKDRLVEGVWPQFLAPQPLNEKYFLVTAKLSKNSLWGLYLVDIYDNVTPVASYEGYGIGEAIPVVKKNTPPVIPEKVRLNDKESTLFIQDIYEGPGLRGVPRGTVKELRIFAYEFAYNKSPSGHMHHGIQAGWDMKRILGTVPVEEDGSVMFKIPANVPISIQPLDADGAALQQMRSWLTGMPGEIVSCVGCHENQNTIAKPKYVMAARKKPQTLMAPKGGVRPFTFKTEVQPLLDRKCISCHDGTNGNANFKDTSADPVTGFGKSYLALHPFVNRQGPEADIYVMNPGEFHANTSKLIQELKRGHYNVELTNEEYRKLYQWIDLNAPYTGVLVSNKFHGYEQNTRRRELTKKYNNVEVDWQTELDDYVKYLNTQDKTPVLPHPPLAPYKPVEIKLNGWPFTAQKAVQKQQELGTNKKTIEIAPGITINMVKIPAGEFVMGSEYGYSDQRPRSVVKIQKAFWMAELEITNEQYTAIMKEHDSRYIPQFWKDHINPGYPANKPKQPAVRMSWNEANEYCKALSKKLGMNIKLPTEAQWEWACRAGTDTPNWFGDSHTNFASYANLADKQLRNMAVTGVDPQPMDESNPLKDYFDYLPRSKFVDDGHMLSTFVGQYQANPWGLKDMIGNVAEWTRSNYAPYPYSETVSTTTTANKVARGGSWRDRIEKTTSASRKQYPQWQRVLTVGFRIIIEE